MIDPSDGYTNPDVVMTMVGYSDNDDSIRCYYSDDSSQTFSLHNELPLLESEAIESWELYYAEVKFCDLFIVEVKVKGVLSTELPFDLTFELQLYPF